MNGAAKALSVPEDATLPAAIRAFTAIQTAHLAEERSAVELEVAAEALRVFEDAGKASSGWSEGNGPAQWEDDGSAGDKRMQELWPIAHGIAVRLIADMIKPGRGTKARSLAPSIDADDLSQEALSRLLAYEQEGHAVRYPAAWLKTVTRNLLLDQLRRVAPTELLPDPKTGVSDHSADATDMILSISSRAGTGESTDTVGRLFMHQLLGLLNERDAALLAYRAVEGWSAKEVAELLDTTPAAVDQGYRRAKVRLKAILDQNPGLRAELGRSASGPHSSRRVARPHVRPHQD